MDRFIQLQDYLLSIYSECDQIFSLLGMVLGGQDGMRTLLFGRQQGRPHPWGRVSSFHPA